MLSIFHFAISIRADHGDRSLLGEDYRKGLEELMRSIPDRRVRDLKRSGKGLFLLLKY